MDEINTDTTVAIPTDDVTITYKYEQPTIGEQAASAAVALGLSLAAGAVVLGAGALYQWGAGKYQNRKFRIAQERAEAAAEEAALEDD